jgi:hypothetical protein
VCRSPEPERLILPGRFRFASRSAVEALRGVEMPSRRNPHNSSIGTWKSRL